MLLAGAFTGLLSFLSFPKFSLSWLAWVALIPLLVAMLRSPRALRAFWAGYAAGAVFFAGSCPWVYTTLHRYGDLSPAISALAFGLFLLLMGFFWALFACLGNWLGRRQPRFAPLNLAALWTAIELLRTHVPFGGFPWNLLGASQVDHAGFMLALPVGGIYGASFLVALGNVLMASLLLRGWLLRKPDTVRCWPARGRKMVLAEAGILFCVVGFATFPYDPAPMADPVKLAGCLVQPVTSFNTTWNDAVYAAFLDRMDRLTRSCSTASGPPPGLVIWPEQPAPLEYQLQPQLQTRLSALASGLQSVIVLEEVGYSRYPSGLPRLDQPHNSALEIFSNGRPGKRYDKVHLVPFGEDLPLPGWLRRIPVIKRWTMQAGNFVPGRRLTLLSRGRYRFGVLICYESDFPQLARRMTDAGANWLVNLSDDGWYGNSAAARQSLVGARLRAMENRRWLLRATNDGITAVIDPYGRVVARLPRWRRLALSAAFSPRSRLTFYTRRGDWPAWLCAIIVMLAAAVALVLRRRRARS